MDMFRRKKIEKRNGSKKLWHGKVRLKNIKDQIKEKEKYITLSCWQARIYFLLACVFVLSFCPLEE